MKMNNECCHIVFHQSKRLYKQYQERCYGAHFIITYNKDTHISKILDTFRWIYIGVIDKCNCVSARTRFFSLNFKLCFFFVRQPTF